MPTKRNSAVRLIIRVYWAPPPEAQLASTRDRYAGSVARLQHGNAQSLPFADAILPLAVIVLIAFFVPDPARAVVELIRAVQSGGRRRVREIFRREDILCI